MAKKLIHLPLVVSCGLLLCHPWLHAQPDAGTLSRELQKEQETRKLPDTLPSFPAQQAPKDDISPALVRISGFVLGGVTLLEETSIQSVLLPWVGKSVPFSGLQQAADAVTGFYRSQGYLVRTYLPEQELGKAIVKLVVVEGRLGSIDIRKEKGSTSLSDQQIQHFIASRNGVGKPIRPDDLQRSITLLNALPGAAVSSVLEPGKSEGESLLAVNVGDTPKYTGYAQLDNSGATSTGETRLTLGMNINSPLHVGDQLAFSANASDHSSYYRAAYTLPLGYDGLRIGASVSNLPYSYQMLSTVYAGTADLQGLNFIYPLLRSNERNLSVGMTFDQKRYANTVQGLELSKKKVDVSALSLSGDALDGWLGGGLTQFTLSYSAGHLDLSGNVADQGADQVSNGASRQGDFSKLAWNIGRLQRLTPEDTLALTYSGQLASKNFDSSEKFLATGPDAVRAYSSSEVSGDEGSMVNVELRHKISDDLTVSVFFDSATLTRDKYDNVGTLNPKTGTYSGTGIGFTYGAAATLLIKGSVAWRNGSNPFANAANGNDADGSLKDPRVWISLLKTF